MDLIALGHGLPPFPGRREPAANGPAPARNEPARNWEVLLQAGAVPEEKAQSQKFLKYLCGQLEAVAVGCVLRAARASLPADGLFSGGFAGSMYQDMADEEYARLIARRGGFGLSDALFRQVAGRRTYGQGVGASRPVQATVPQGLARGESPGISGAGPQEDAAASDN